MVTFLDATGVDPKVLQAVVFGLFSAQPDLVVASLVLANAIYQVLEGNLLGIRSPCVRKNRIPGNIVANKVVGQAELASAVALQKTHYSDPI